ncbi:MAG: hypothetical protein LQ352_000702 [Teloschistes flavicans]|nr:MAG: hypothetical protein LQ352_000702 [Teloschistes flavicans]
MDSGGPSETTRAQSPDPSSHATNIYDIENGQDEWLDEEDDDDMDFEPATDESEAMEFFDPAEAEESEFHDADDGLSGVEIDFSANDDENVEEDETGLETGVTGTERPLNNSVPVGRIQVTHNQIMRLFGHAGLRDLFTNHRSGDSGNLSDDDDDSDNGYGNRRRRRGKASKGRYPAVPSEEGERLMAAGTFGESEHFEDKLRNRKRRLATRLMYRELGTSPYAPNRANKLAAQSLIPSSNADTIIHYNDRCYSGQFSDDGNFFFSCGKDFKVRMYDTSNPYEWKYYKTAIYPYGQWTITDASLSPDNRFLAYSSIRSVVCLAPTDPTLSADSPLFLDFSDMGQISRQDRFRGGHSNFGIWSIRFSGDGREVIAGTSNQSVYVYDIEAKRSILQIRGHNDDVNAVCFGDKSSPHILYSGSDDTLIKVWDRRSMGDSREAGVFMGHTEGLTYVDSKGDGRYVLSNGKDQTMKLWDLRKMMPTEKASKLDPGSYSTGFDYRFMAYTEAEYDPHPYDCSLVTFRGHRVLKTLIRCHFSPPASTDSRYVYSGSEDGSVYIYNMDATLAGRINVNKATHHSRPKEPEFYPHQYEIRNGRNLDAWKTCVRDASWHPDAPVIAATSWNGWGMSTGTCTTHTWNDGAEDDESEPKMGLRVNQILENDEDLYDRPRRNDRLSQTRSRLLSQVVRAADDDDGVVW